MKLILNHVPIHNLIHEFFFNKYGLHNGLPNFKKGLKMAFGPLEVNIQIGLFFHICGEAKAGYIEYYNEAKYLYIHLYHGCKKINSPILILFSSKIWLRLYNPWLTFGFFILFFWIFIPFIARNFFWVLSGYMLPKNRTLVNNWKMPTCLILNACDRKHIEHPCSDNKQFWVYWYLNFMNLNS